MIVLHMLHPEDTITHALRDMVTYVLDMDDSIAHVCCTYKSVTHVLQQQRTGLIRVTPMSQCYMCVTQVQDTVLHILHHKDKVTHM